MPLIVFASFFALLFCLEGAWFSVRAAAEEDALRRYQAVEHPRRMTSDRYIDML